MERAQSPTSCQRRLVASVLREGAGLELVPGRFWVCHGVWLKKSFRFVGRAQFLTFQERRLDASALRGGAGLARLCPSLVLPRFGLANISSAQPTLSARTEAIKQP